jgi:imidazole glycerol-phosphate synthase subunit HisF
VIATRLLPCLLLKGRGLVKTKKFRDPVYLGDPRNVVRIFNEREVDELVILDITATPEGHPPQFDLIREIVSEAFMPVAYGGGIRSLEDAKKMLSLGVEKVVVNTYAVERPEFVREAADLFGSQSVVVCMDVKSDFWGRKMAYTHGGRKRSRYDPVELALEMEARGAGELVVNSIDRDGVMQGYDIDLIRSVAQKVTVPVIACGGAGKLEHCAQAVAEGGAAAAAAGSIFVFHGEHRAVLISYPPRAILKNLFSNTRGNANHQVV